MSKICNIREICGDYALDVEYSADNVFTMFFNSHRNALIVKRIIEIDGSVPNVATAVKFDDISCFFPSDARWKGCGMGDYYCSSCQFQQSGRSNYCPNCGKKMD